MLLTRDLGSGTSKHSNSCGRGALAQEIGGRDPKTQQWKCTSECKLPTTDEKQHIVDLKSMVRTLRRGLDAVDSGCQNGHYTCKATGRDLAGHPLTCTVAGSNSKLRTLRAAAPHYPVLPRFEAIRYHKLSASIDSALRAGKFASLALFCGIDGYKYLFSSESRKSTIQPVVDIKKSNLPDIESELHAEMISELEKKLADDPEVACCSCERL